MKYVDIRDLPPCSYSPECLRLIDDLDTPAMAHAPVRLSYIDDLHDRRRLRQLRSHVPGCPTCSALLAETRRMRTQQRLMLHRFLIANEKRVPSTTGAIFAAIQREQSVSQEIDPFVSDEALETLFVEQDETLALDPAPLSTRSFLPRHIFRNVLTLATVAAVILAAVGFLNRFTNQQSLTSTSESLPHRPAPPNTVANNYGWDTAIIGLALLSASGFTIYSFNAANGQMTTLFATNQEISDLNMDEVSSDGQTLLYDVVSPEQQTTYRTFSSSSHSRDVYNVQSRQEGNAIWMDTEHVLVEAQGMVIEVDTSNGHLQQSWSIATNGLAFYHQPFLYFTDASQGNVDTLYRINLSQNNATPQEIASALPNTRFWLSPDGTTISFASNGSYGAEGIYSVHSDGTHLTMLRPGPGSPIGYADDQSLMLMQQVGTRVEVIKLGVTPEEKEQVVLANAAPGATSLCSPSLLDPIIALCSQDIALEPYGHGLLLHAYYANGSHSLVYDNLATGTSQTVLNLANGANVQLPGWSKISSGETGLTSSLALCA